MKVLLYSPKDIPVHVSLEEGRGGWPTRATSAA